MTQHHSSVASSSLADILLYKAAQGAVTRSTTRKQQYNEHVVAVHSPAAGTVDIFARIGGSGPPVVLLGGYPQTTRMWRRVAPALAKHFTVVVADIRGYGRSGKPKMSDSHVEYSKREMATDIVLLMKDLGHAKFDVLSHDRGAHVAHRLAIDYPDTVDSMIIMDIAPLTWVYDHVDDRVADAYFHWFFLCRSHPETEAFILSNPKAWFDLYLKPMNVAAAGWSAQDEAEYLGVSSTPEAVHAHCEDYRAGAGIDLRHERESVATHKGMSVRRLKIVWGGSGLLPKVCDPVAIWREVSAAHVDVSGHEMAETGHYIAEQRPEQLVRIALDFFGH